MTTVNTKPLSDSVGAEVLDVDRDRLLHDEGLADECLELLDRHGVLVFRELHLDDDAQVAFSRRLGPVERVGRRDDGAEIFRVTLDPAKNPAADYLKGTFDWHIDGMTDDIPIMATVLSAHEVAAKGGDTEFASTYAAYEDLSDDEKERALAARVVHSFLAAQVLSHPNASQADIEFWSQRPPKTHPLVWRHQNGRNSLVLGATTDHVEGMGEDEGRAYLDDLLDRSTVAERVYRHEWAVGDLVIWDNRGVLHR
ncbi:MAG TPA: TauD/TfdA family dioxygenase, partial [Acidimicrobiia bacterium]|nr:TauD/TfdA family dioxygenase [Acidimicrobiia bacterium]